MRDTEKKDAINTPGVLLLLSGLPDSEQLMQKVGCSRQQGSPCDVQGLLPPGVRAQNRHDASVVLQGKCDDIAIQRLLLLGAAQPERQAVIPPEFNHARSGRGEASSPVHPPTLGYRRPASPLLQSPHGFMETPRGSSMPWRLSEE